MIGVKESVSRHSVSLDQRGWRKPDLNPNILTEFIERLIKDDDPPTAAGKRQRTEDTETQDGPLKRQRLTDIADETLVKAEDEQSGSFQVPAFKHTYDFTFTLSPPHPDNRDTQVTKAFRREVEVLKESLSSCSQYSAISDRDGLILPTTITKPYPDDGSRCVLVVHLLGFEDNFLYLHLDHAPGRQGPGDHHPLEPIGSAHLLAAYDSVELTFTVRLWPTVDPDHSLEHALPLKISIDMEGSLIFPGITHAPKTLGRRSRGGFWNAFVGYLFPAMNVPNYRGETDIAFLYSILEPAPPLPPLISPADVQQDALLPSLLPFQRRSVMWMLQREGKTLDEKGRVVPFVPHHLPLFWEVVELGGQKLYLNRVREILSLEPPPPCVEHPGGSLNEAPGLGKTVECMALILLNPDIRRNPSVKRWDADAKVHVREVHVSGYVPFILTFVALLTHRIPDRRRS